MSDFRFTVLMAASRFAHYTSLTINEASPRKPFTRKTAPHENMRRRIRDKRNYCTVTVMSSRYM
jgi:hypothetical protein